MKNMIFLFIFFASSCHTNNTIISSKPLRIKSKIINCKENKEVNILISDRNDIIEVFKKNSCNKCKKIKLGNSYSFKVIPVSDLIRHGVESPNEYILNDSTIIKYNHYYTLEKDENICIVK